MSVSFIIDSQLQVGIEIEFVAPHNTPWEEANLPALDPFNNISLGKDACFHRLAAALDDAGLSACYQMKTTALNCPRDPLREHAPKGSIVLDTYRLVGRTATSGEYDARRDGREGLFRYWLVKGEYNLTEAPAYQSWVMCELNTPIWTEMELAGDLPDLDAALGAVNGAFDETPHVFPRRCGLHIHLSPTSGGSVAFAQRILTLVIQWNAQ